jgi:hypothetical protein
MRLFSANVKQNQTWQQLNTGRVLFCPAGRMDAPVKGLFL